MDKCLVIHFSEARYYLQIILWPFSTTIADRRLFENNNLPIKFNFWFHTLETDLRHATFVTKV